MNIYISRLFKKPTRLSCNAACNRGKPTFMLLQTETGKAGFDNNIYLAIEASKKELKVKIKVKFEKKIEIEEEFGMKN